MKYEKLRPALPFVVDLTKNCIYCQVCGKSEQLPDDYDHAKKPKGYFDDFKAEHVECKNTWKNDKTL